MAVHIRPATSQDAAAIAAAWNDAHADELRTPAQVAFQLEDVARPPLAATLVALHGAAVVGVGRRDGPSPVRFVPQAATRCEISLWVHPAARRRGIGSLLLERLAHVPRAMGVRFVSLKMREVDSAFAILRGFREVALERYFEVDAGPELHARVDAALREAAVAGYAFESLGTPRSSDSGRVECAERLLASVGYGEAFGDGAGARQDLLRNAAPSTSLFASLDGQAVAFAATVWEGNSAAWLEGVAHRTSESAALAPLLAAVVRAGLHANGDFFRSVTEHAAVAQALEAIGFHEEGVAERVFTRQIR